MPNIKLPYSAEGIELADKIADKVENVGGDISQDMPMNDASMRNTNMSMDVYEGGGNVNVDSMGYYKEGGKVSLEKTPGKEMSVEQFKILSDIDSELRADRKGELKNKPYKRKYTQETKVKPKYGKDAAESVASKKNKITKRKKNKKKDANSYIQKEGNVYKKGFPDRPLDKKKKPKFMGKEYGMGGSVSSGDSPMTENALGQIEGKVYKK